MVVSPVFVGHDNVAIIVTIHLLVSLVDTPLVPGLGTAVAVGQLVKLGAQLLRKCFLAFNAIPRQQSILVVLVSEVRDPIVWVVLVVIELVVVSQHVDGDGRDPLLFDVITTQS